MLRKNRISFPYIYENIPFLGKTFIPEISIKLKTTEGFVNYKFIVDTGAELTTLPYFMADKLNIDLNKATESIALGIGGFKMKSWITKINLYFDHAKPVNIRASITSENVTPFLLGRVDLLDVLHSWNFDSRNKKIIFEEI